MTSECNFVIVGPGKVGSTLAILASAANYEISGIIARTQGSCLKIKQLLKLSGEKYLSFENINTQVLENADFIAIAVNDDEIPTVTNKLAQLNFINLRNGVVFHCSGHKSSDLLEKLADKGLQPASLHPLKSIADPKIAADSFAGTYCAIEGKAKAVEKLENLIAKFRGVSFQIASKDKPLYHAAAVIACNYWITLLDVSLQIYKNIGIDNETGQKLLHPLIQGTLNNFIKNGTPQALTGPIERGDFITIKEHLQNIKTDMPKILEFYKMLGRFTLNVADRKGLDDVQSKKISSLLNDKSSTN